MEKRSQVIKYKVCTNPVSFPLYGMSDGVQEVGKFLSFLTKSQPHNKRRVESSQKASHRYSSHLQPHLNAAIILFVIPYFEGF